jgi:hypothetical protein
MHTVIESAVENGLDPTACIEYLLETLPNVTTSALDDLLPWSPSLPPSLRLPTLLTD